MGQLQGKGLKNYGKIASDAGGANHRWILTKNQFGEENALLTYTLRQ
jgi:hypothetical protein